MKSSNFIENIRTNTRTHEKRLRDIEYQLSEAHEQELRIQHEITSGLREIVTLQLQHNPKLDTAVQKQLKMRTEENVFLRSQLESFETRIASKLIEQQAAANAVNNEREAVNTALKANAAYQKLSGDLVALAGELRAAEKNYDEIRHECDTKLKDYAEARLYQYLRAAAYGTDTYVGGRFIRFMDGWIARMSNYQTNKHNEAVLMAMRQQNIENFTAMGSREVNIKIQLDEICTQAESSSKLKDLTKTKKQIGNDVASLKKAANDMHEQMKQFTLKTDGRYVQARELIASALKSSSVDELLQRVKETESLVDDALAQKVITLRATLERHRLESKQMNQEMEQAKATYERAKKLERNLTESRYSSDRYEYDNSLDVSALITGFMIGSLSESSVVAEVQRKQHEIPEEPSYYTSSSSSSSYNRSSYDNDSSGFSFSTSDSSNSSSDSFSTSDSF